MLGDEEEQNGASASDEQQGVETSTMTSQSIMDHDETQQNSERMERRSGKTDEKRNLSDKQVC